VYNSKTLTVEESIHVRFNDNKPDTTMSKLDESFAEMKIENIVKFATMSSKDRLASNSLVDDQLEEVREPTRRLPRKHHPKS